MKKLWSFLLSLSMCTATLLSEPWLVLKNNHKDHDITCYFFFIVNIADGVKILETPHAQFHFNIQNINTEKHLMQLVGAINLPPQSTQEINYALWTKDMPVAPTIDYIQTQAHTKTKHKTKEQMFYFLGHNSNWKILEFDILETKQIILTPQEASKIQQLKWLTHKSKPEDNPRVVFSLQSK